MAEGARTGRSTQIWCTFYGPAWGKDIWKLKYEHPRDSIPGLRVANTCLSLDRFDRVTHKFTTRVQDTTQILFVNEQLFLTCTCAPSAESILLLRIVL